MLENHIYLLYLEVNPLELLPLLISMVGSRLGCCDKTTSRHNGLDKIEMYLPAGQQSRTLRRLYHFSCTDSTSGSKAAVVLLISQVMVRRKGDKEMLTQSRGQKSFVLISH